MRILYINENIEKGNRGGDMVQMLNTKSHLESLYDIDIILCTNINDDDFFKNVDAVHIFNIQTIDYTLRAAEKAHYFGLKIFLSTIFWDLKDACNVNLWNRFFKITPNNFVKLLKPISNFVYFISCNLLKKKTSIMFDKKREVFRVLELADYLLPNSNEEMELLIKAYNLDKNISNKTCVVPNAIDLSFIEKNINLNTNTPIKNYVLQVGAINPVKNQINVVKALKKYKDIPIVFIGKNCDDRYFNKLKRISDKRGNVYFINQISNSDVIGYYKNAVCHILPSFRESPGLVSLEALAAKTQIVVSNKKYCPIDYYSFNELANVCNPYSPSSIRKCVLNAINQPKCITSHMAEELLTKCSYDNVAKLTYSCYLKLI